ncbi:hypothetical protein HYH03_002399 [Edaphochlamys debaryana]|uniref:Peptidase M11 gametolysin domain-containing protein n=1 Tax=Edaphochlamys debaryana TaxID=47281 RepID=A0A836C573_9CHLO|nr:hypothetical protein HYH03_002399 [Edaphochlamys debaryana]|eukprot:KAG2499452.1 hypothetical protein HYH03_002399 [Edaphochlamys debaryana]
MRVGTRQAGMPRILVSAVLLCVALAGASAAPIVRSPPSPPRAKPPPSPPKGRPPPSPTKSRSPPLKSGEVPPSPKPPRPPPSPYKLVPKPAASPPPPAPSADVTGRITVKDVHRGEGAYIWSLLLPSGNALRLLQGQPLAVSGELVQAGARVALECEFTADRTACVRVTRVRINRLAAVVPATDIVIKALTIVTSLTGSCTRAGARLADVQRAMTPYADFFKSCSYGAMTFDTAGSKVIAAAVPCSASILACNEEAIAAAADRAARTQLGDDAVDQFTHTSFVLPTGLVNRCGWVGLAELPGYRTWFTPDNDGFFHKGTYMQEIVHNFGIYHGWRNGIEYNDASTSMGEGKACPSAPELWRLGWAKPVAELNAAGLPEGQSLQFSLPPTYLSSKNMLKIKPEWLGDSYSKNVYVALRVARGGDSDLLPEFREKINVHEVNQRIDSSFTAAGDPKVSIIATIADGGSLDLKAYRLMLRFTDLRGDKTLATVRVCRYRSKATECKDADTPDPSPFDDNPPPADYRWPPPGEADYAPPPPYEGGWWTLEDYWWTSEESDD